MGNILWIVVLRYRPFVHSSEAVWPDWAIYWTLGNFSKSAATISLPKSPTFLGNYCKGVKILNFSSEIIFRQLLQTFGNFWLVTLVGGGDKLFFKLECWEVILWRFANGGVRGIGDWMIHSMISMSEYHYVSFRYYFFIWYVHFLIINFSWHC